MVVDDRKEMVVQLANRYHHLLETIHQEWPQLSWPRDVTRQFGDIGQSDLMKHKTSGLLGNEPGDRDEPKDWRLDQNTKRWLG